MKKQLTGFGFSVLIIAAVTFTASTQQEKDKNNEKKQQPNQAKKDVKNNQGKNDVKNNQGKNDVKDNQGKKDVMDNHGKNDMKDNNGKNDNDNNVKNDDKMNKGHQDRDYGYEWDRETFKDRKKIKSKEKVTVCHKFNRDNEPAVTIRVSSNALKAHMNHGDVMGECPTVSDRRFSDDFLRKRTDYYNNLQESEEKVLYSRSILDYALARLTDSRTQLATYRNNNMPLADIERKQAAVLELEQNVSLLETLIGAAVTMVVNKFQ